MDFLTEAKSYYFLSSGKEQRVSYETHLPAKAFPKQVALFIGVIFETKTARKSQYDHWSLCRFHSSQNPTQTVPRCRNTCLLHCRKARPTPYIYSSVCMVSRPLSQKQPVDPVWNLWQGTIHKHWFKFWSETT